MRVAEAAQRAGTPLRAVCLFGGRKCGLVLGEAASGVALRKQDIAAVIMDLSSLDHKTFGLRNRLSLSEGRQGRLGAAQHAICGGNANVGAASLKRAFSFRKRKLEGFERVQGTSGLEQIFASQRIKAKLICQR